jgi:hypothetical protein
MRHRPVTEVLDWKEGKQRWEIIEKTKEVIKKITTEREVDPGRVWPDNENMLVISLTSEEWMTLYAYLGEVPVTVDPYGKCEDCQFEPPSLQGLPPRCRACRRPEMSLFEPRK